MALTNIIGVQDDGEGEILNLVQDDGHWFRRELVFSGLILAGSG